MKTEIESSKAASYEVVRRTATEVASSSKKEVVKISTKENAAEQLVDEIFKTSFTSSDIRRIYLKQVHEDGTAKAWSYETAIGLKFAPEGKVVDLLAPPP